MSRKTIRLDKAEQGQKLASAVVTVAGQRLLPAGTVLDDSKIELLKKHNVRYVQVHERAFEEEEIDASVFTTVIKNLTSSRPDAAVKPPAVESEPESEVKSPPSRPTPVPAPEATPKTDAEKLAAVTQKASDLRGRLAADKKNMADRFGERYTSVSYTMGDPKPGRATSAYAPYVDLLGLLARDLTDKLIFERRVDADTIQVLARDVVSELATRGSVMELLTAAYSTSRYLLAHMVNVGLFSMRVAAEMKLSQEEVTDTAVGAILHDIGMVLIPVGFWTSRRELTPRARDEIQKHPELGANLIRETPNTKEAWSIPAIEHHERLDGGGYPGGRVGGEISISSRIVQICDVYDAMTSDRTYRYAKYPDVAMKHILGSPEQFDRDIAQIFCKCLGFYPDGYQVKLSTGEDAVVLSSNPKNIFRPIIRILTDAYGVSLPPDARLEIDLTNRLDLRIVEISNRRPVS